MKTWATHSATFRTSWRSILKHWRNPSAAECKLNYHCASVPELCWYAICTKWISLVRDAFWWLSKRKLIHSGLVNGATGTVLAMTHTFIRTQFDQIPEPVTYSEFTNIFCKLQFTIYFENYTNFFLNQKIFGICLVNIPRIKVTFNLKKAVNEIQRHQFPLTLAYAITIHKAQGTSTDVCIADLGASVFTEAMSYVALSRVRFLNGLYLIDYSRPHIAVNKVALEVGNFVLETNFFMIGIQSSTCHQWTCADRWWEHESIANSQHLDNKIRQNNCWRNSRILCSVFTVCWRWRRSTVSVHNCRSNAIHFGWCVLDTGLLFCYFSFNWLLHCSWKKKFMIGKLKSTIHKCFPSISPAFWYNFTNDRQSAMRSEKMGNKSCGFVIWTHWLKPAWTNLSNKLEQIRLRQFWRQSSKYCQAK